MIRHVCMFTLKEENKENNIAEYTPDSNYDVALIFDFDSAQTLDAYQKSPQHVEFGEFVYTVRVNRACIDYEI